MGRREEEVEAGRRHGRHKASPSPTRGEEDEEAIRNKLRESGWKKRRAEDSSAADVEPSNDLAKAKERLTKSPPRASDDRRSSKPSRSSRRSRSPRRHEREHRSSRRKSSGSRRRSPSRSRTPASRSRSRSAVRRRRRHSSSSRKRRSSRSPSRSRDARESKRSRRAASRSRSTSAAKKKTSLSVKEEEKKEEKKEDEEETENEDDVDKTKNGKKDEDEKEGDKKKDDRLKPSSSRKSSRRSRSGSPQSPSRSSRRRRHRRNLSYSRSRSPSRSRRARRGGSRSRSRSPPRDRRSRGRDHDRRSRRRGRSGSRSGSPSNSRRRRRNDRSSSRTRPSRRDTKSSPEPQQQPPAATAAAPAAAPTAAATAPGPAAAAPTAGVNPTITQLMAQYPTMSLQDIIAKMQASNVTMAAAVAQKPARELYVGNLPPNVTGPQLQEFLSTIIQQVGLTTQPGNPIVNTWISTDGHFAFCEMRSVEECNLALLLNQLSLLGQPLKFGRPRSFMGPPQPMPQISTRAQTALTNLGCTPNPAWFAQPTVSSISEATLAPLSEMATVVGVPLAATSVIPAVVPVVAAATAALGASSPAHRLIMSNIPVVLTEDQVKELVLPFGALKTFTLVKDPATGTSLGSALFEYEDDAVAAQAVEGLNGLSIGGILLSVQRQPPNGPAALGVLPIVATNPEDQPSPVVKMANMVSIDELRDDDEYADLAEDVEEECKRFGSVTGMEIPRPKDGEEVPGLSCIYVRFEKEEDAVSALKALNGRKFGGNIVKVTYFPVDNFEKRVFS